MASSSSLSLDKQQAHAVARGLGWFSIALGVAEVLLPKTMARATGTSSTMLLRLYGLREIAAGVGILAGRDPAPWLWARVGGDALDAATLAAHLHRGNPQATSTAVSLAAVAGVAALDVACARACSEAPPAPAVDYSGRRGLPLPPEEMRGAALEDFVAPPDMRTPPALAPYPPP